MWRSNFRCVTTDGLWALNFGLFYLAKHLPAALGGKDVMMGSTGWRLHILCNVSPDMPDEHVGEENDFGRIIL